VHTASLFHLLSRNKTSRTVLSQIVLSCLTTSIKKNNVISMIRLASVIGPHPPGIVYFVLNLVMTPAARGSGRRVQFSGLGPGGLCGSWRLMPP
jgi:hypothetical protein